MRIQSDISRPSIILQNTYNEINGQMPSIQNVEDVHKKAMGTRAFV